MSHDDHALSVRARHQSSLAQLPLLATFTEFVLQSHCILAAIIDVKKCLRKVVLLHYCKLKKTAAESHRILVEVYGEHDLAERS